MSNKLSREEAPLYLGELELFVLLAVQRLGGNAYGVTVRDLLHTETRRDLTLGTVYKSLSRLEAKGYLSSREGDPTPERGGRRKRLYELEALGARAVAQWLGALRRLAGGKRRELEAL